MFRSKEEILNRLTDPGMVTLLAFLLIVIVLTLYGMYVNEHEKERRVSTQEDLPAARVRGYVRKFGTKFEYGIRSVETGVRQRLGFRHTMSDAEQVIKSIMEPVQQSRVQRGADGS